jgi:mono/diheme cytochrome c family protein
MLRLMNLFTLIVGIFAVILLIATNGFAGGDAAAGKAVYDKNCSACHGADGNSPMEAMGVPSFAKGQALDKPLAERFESVCKGKESAAGLGAPPMPPFCDTLSEADINNALAYEETFKP